MLLGYQGNHLLTGVITLKVSLPPEQVPQIKGIAVPKHLMAPNTKLQRLLADRQLLTNGKAIITEDRHQRIHLKATLNNPCLMVGYVKEWAMKTLRLIITPLRVYLTDQATANLE